MRSEGVAQLQRELVEQAQRGSADAFSTLVAPTADRLYGIAYRILRDADRAEDATQRALIDTWQHLSDLRDPDRFEAWTCRLVVREAYREARHESRWLPSAGLIAEHQSAEPDPATTITTRDELERGFRQLSAEHRAVLVLHHYLGLPVAEIAQVLGIPAGTVASRLHYAMGRLRAALEADARSTLVAGQVA
jgi:RNA polymerase sigma factor (sigma-70 family)